MSKSYENFEDDEKIICPYCNKAYEPSPDETIIGDRWVDCYTEEEYIYTCDCCNKKFCIPKYVNYDYEPVYDYKGRRIGWIKVWYK